MFGKIKGQFLLSVGILATFVYGLYRHYSPKTETALIPPALEQKVEVINEVPVVSETANKPQKIKARKTKSKLKSSPGVKPILAPTYKAPSNPYKALSQQYGGKSMQETFGSINRDSVQNSDTLRKNAYFKKLSEQLKNLQNKEPVPDGEQVLTPPPEVDIEYPPSEPDENKPLNTREDSQFPPEAALTPEEEIEPPFEENSEEGLLDELDDLLNDSP